VFGQSSKFKWPEDDSLLVETCSHMKCIIYIYIYIYIYTYIVAIDRHLLSFVFSIKFSECVFFQRTAGFGSTVPYSMEYL
jgi:hypothetical protein